MAKRKRVALIYAYNENWIGGTYYIENLIAALAQLPDAQQPELLIFSWTIEDAERLQQAVKYSYWSFRRFERTLTLPERILNKITATLLGRRYISYLYSDIDLVFPLPAGWRHYFARIPHHVYWIPDFQEHYLPTFFKSEEIQERKLNQQLILEIGYHIVFSSNAAQSNFKEIYPNSIINAYVLQFAVTNRLTQESTSNCLARYNIGQPYFICSNQFWKHKNHPTVLRAIVELRRTHPHALVIFTGKEYDYRNSTYFTDLIALQKSLNLKEEVKFLGFIPREDQLILMQEAIAVIQPSLFEGWSTVVEDSKALNVPLIVSDLEVHREQLSNYSSKLFFEPENNIKLAQCMAQALDGKLPKILYNYQNDIIKFGQKFMHVVHQITTI
jgi:glycosyltransferase involved in cell wall biosynthesis